MPSKREEQTQLRHVNRSMVAVSLLQIGPFAPQLDSKFAARSQLTGGITTAVS
ncbi:hypothetical protein ANCCAN_06517 [Ancylostoma caninum]|uniref:Uncharacterized protein n=1 Tax=Ancylostoma caninum TaxID=29170 RepID=A0A368GSN4_ANCCA|nr:hypothetical protein ANCCAN_06517 [Ancylostoma caninum]